MATDTQPLDLSTFQWPEVTGVDLAFPTFDTIKELLIEAQRREKDDNHRKDMRLAEEIFQQHFFNGGQVIHLPETITLDTWQNKAFKYYQCFRGSWAPKHEHKSSICALILCETIDLEKTKKLIK